jgi:hypothetical protein
MLRARNTVMPGIEYAAETPQRPAAKIAIEANPITSPSAFGSALHLSTVRQYGHSAERRPNPKYENRESWRAEIFDWQAGQIRFIDACVP